MKNKTVSVILALALVFTLCACGRTENKTQFNIPFGEDLRWDWTEADARSALGEPDEVYPSVYNGNALTYTREYLDRGGTLKLMFDEKGKLASAAWAYFTGDGSEIDALNKTVLDKETELHGEPYSPDSKGTSGSVWYTDNGDILITSIGVNGSYGFQYSYIDRDHSGR